MLDRLFTRKPIKPAIALTSSFSSFKNEPPLLQVLIYTKKESCPAFCCFSKSDTHSAALVWQVDKNNVVKKGPLGKKDSGVKKDTNDENEFWVNYGFFNYNVPKGMTLYDHNKGILEHSIYDEDKYYPPVRLYAYEQRENKTTFKNFVLESQREYPLSTAKHNHFTHNCTHAAAHPIRFFGINKHETTRNKIVRIIKKITCGFFGTCLGISRCPTCPTVMAPAELNRYALSLRDSPEQRRLQRAYSLTAALQEPSESKSPRSESMSDDEVSTSSTTALLRGTIRS